MIIPVNIVTTAKRHNINVIPEKLNSKNGYIMKDSSGNIKLYFNRDLSYPLQRYIIASGIGHTIAQHLNKDSSIELDDIDFNTKDYKKLEADILAMDLLIPDDIIENYLYNLGIIDINRLARIFDVPKEIMEYKLNHFVNIEK